MSKLLQLQSLLGFIGPVLHTGEVYKLDGGVGASAGFYDRRARPDDVKDPSPPLRPYGPASLGFLPSFIVDTCS